MKLFKAYFDCGDDCFKVVRPAESKAKFIERFGGNGEIIKLEEVTEEYPLDVEYLFDFLHKYGWGEAETHIITECVRKHYENIKD